MATPTVLYVEDEEFDVLFMRRAFQRAGLEQHLKVVADGQQALDLPPRRSSRFFGLAFSYS